MKKFTTVLCITALLINMAAMTGCNSNGESSDTPNSSGGSSAITEGSDSSENSENSDSSDISDGSENSDNSDSDPEPQKPEGEPTFLTLPDGTPIYTSEITKYQNPSEFHGTHEQYPLDTFNKETFTDVECPEVVCDGFALAFIPRPNISISDNPDKFTESNGIFTYTGDDMQPSREYFRLKVGDKFGSLTAKSAQVRFSNYKAQWYGGDPDAIAGIYLTGAEIKYEGEVEMTGSICVMKTEGYHTEGDLWFYPEGGCVSQIPAADYHFDSSDPGAGVHHCASGGYVQGGYVYGELNLITLGNMYDFGNVDFDGLQPGDSVRVKITVKDPIAGYSWGSPWCEGEPAAVEVLDQ